MSLAPEPTPPGRRNPGVARRHERSTPMTIPAAPPLRALDRA